MIQRKVLLWLLAVLLIGCASQQQRAEEKARMQKAVMEAVADKHWHVDITSMNSMRYGSKMVTPDFFLELRGDTLRSYLPYLGQVHRAPLIAPEQGLNFETLLLSYHVSHPKTHMWLMVMDVKTEEDLYRYRIEMYDTGNTYIHVQSQHRDAISFDGHFAEPEP